MLKPEAFISGTEILLNIVGGVALLLWGTRMVRTGITRSFGTTLRQALAAGTRNRFTAFFAGVAAAGLLQSSTATALMVVSFASRRLTFVPAALALMLGADVGTTLVAQVLSFDLGWVSPALTFTGVVAFMSSKDGQRRHLGRVAIGLGLMLLAIRLIIAASEPLRQSQELDAVLAPLLNEPLLAVLVAALIAWLAHSGLAVVLLVLSLAAAGTVPLPLAFALVLGANVGGAIAPVAATLAAPASA